MKGNHGEIINETRLKQTLAWGSLLGIFPRNGTPTDVDFCVELQGHFLFGEFKRAGMEVPIGQRLALERMVKKLRKGSVCFVAEHNSRPEEIVEVSNCVVVQWFSAERPEWQETECSVELACRHWMAGLPNL